MLEKEDVEEVVTESLDLPPSVLTKLAVNKFNSRYSNISESEKEIIKTVLNGSNEDKEEIFNKLKRECIDTINNKLNESSDLDLKDKLLKVKDKLLNTDFSLDNFKTDIGKIYDLNESI
jgi:Icc-related predicted phosphoesterase